MRRSFLALIVAVVLLVGAPLRADDLVFTLFGAYLEALRTQSAIPGLSAAIVGDTDILWESALGQQDVERSVATRSDTPFHVDGLTEIVTAAVVLRCVEEGKLSLDDTIGQYASTGADPSLSATDSSTTLLQILTHTSGTSDNPVYAYRPERFASLEGAVRACSDHSSRRTLETLLDNLAMSDSVPGADAIHLAPPAVGIPSRKQVERYTGVLQRLATPYSVDAKGRATPSQYTTTTMTPSAGLISTTRDLAKFDLALRQGIVARADTLAASWQPPVGRNGQRLPHAIGWFVQTYKGETVLWQFGMQENASSSLVIKLPGRGLTLILLANSDGLVKPFSPAAGDLTSSPFGRVFLGLFIR
jgi:CubicO group peptidase (beta-lactamase class C family)